MLYFPTAGANIKTISTLLKESPDGLLLPYCTTPSGRSTDKSMSFSNCLAAETEFTGSIHEIVTFNGASLEATNTGIIIRFNWTAMISSTYSFVLPDMPEYCRTVFS